MVRIQASNLIHLGINKGVRNDRDDNSQSISVLDFTHVFVDIFIFECLHLLPMDSKIDERPVIRVSGLEFLVDDCHSLVV